MQKSDKHTGHQPEKDSFGFFSRLEIPWEKSKEEAWLELEGKLRAQPGGKTRPVLKNALKAAATAIVAFGLGFLCGVRFANTGTPAENGANPASVMDSTQVTNNAHRSAATE